MSDALKPYPDHRDSGVPWLGKIPAHWKLRKTKHLFRERSEKGFPNEPLLAATQTKGVVRKEEYESRTVLALKDLHLLKLVRVGDFVISLRSFQGGIEFARHQGIISPAYTILYSIDSAHQPFFAALFKSKPYIENLSLFVTGIRQGQNIDYKRLGNSVLPVPPQDEQTQIARFLDHHDRLTRRYIRAQRRLIELLTERKQALIQQAVTRGLDPHVKLKPSGIEWLGEIPAHWEIQRNSRIFSERNNPGRVNLPIMIVSLNSGVTIGEDIDDKGRPRRLIEDRSAYKFSAQGDIAYNMMRMWQGAVGVVPTDGLVSPAYVVARPLVGVNSQYFVYLFRTGEYKNEINRNSRGIVSDRNRLYWDGFKNLVSLVPPIGEQDAIAEYVVSKSSQIDQAVDYVQRQIDLIHEYRARLIADVVTGKLDVRGISLPDLDKAGDLNSLEDNAEPDDMDAGELNDVDN